MDLDLELTRGIVLLAQPAFPPSVISSFLPQIKGRAISHNPAVSATTLPLQGCGWLSSYLLGA